MPTIIGPDGFLCSAVEPDYASHSILNDMLRELATQPKHAHEAAAQNVARLRRKLSSEQLVALAMAAHHRLLAIAKYSGEEAQSNRWTHHIGAILYHLYAARLPFSSADMGRLLGSPIGKPSVSHVVEYFQTHDLTPGLIAALREWDTSIRAGVGRSYKHVDVQNNLQLLGMLLWHDEQDSLHPDECWSERVRRDYRAMSGERKQRWRALLLQIRGDAGSKPPKAWAKAAQSRLGVVGPEDFRTTIAGWFACFREREPLRLSVVGSHVLKGLLWYCALARDPAVTTAALPVLDAPWKPKRNLDKVMVALSVLIDTMPREDAWAAVLQLQSAWGVSQGCIERLVIRIAASFDMDEAQLRALDVLKPPPPASASSSSDKSSVEWVWKSLALPRSAEDFVGFLNALRSRR